VIYSTKPVSERGDLTRLDGPWDPAALPLSTITNIFKATTSFSSSSSKENANDFDVQSSGHAVSSSQLAASNHAISVDPPAITSEPAFYFLFLFFIFIFYLFEFLSHFSGVKRYADVSIYGLWYRL